MSVTDKFVEICVSPASDPIAASAVLSDCNPTEAAQAIMTFVGTSRPEDTILSAVAAISGVDRRNVNVDAVHSTLLDALTANGPLASNSTAQFQAASLLGHLYQVRYFAEDPFEKLYHAVIQHHEPLPQESQAAVNSCLTLAKAPPSPYQGKLQAAMVGASPDHLAVHSAQPTTTSFTVSEYGRQSTGGLTHSVSVGHSFVAGDEDAASRTFQPSGTFTPATGTISSRNAAAAQSIGMTPQQYEETKARTVYLNRLDPTVTEGQLRDLLTDCGSFTKVRLCGDVVGRARYGFVEFAHMDSARRLLQRDRTMLGTHTMRCLPAKAPIQDNDTKNDAQFDSKRGCIRGCLFGLSF